MQTRVIRTENENSLVEFEEDGLLQRVWIPSKELNKNAKASKEVLAKGMPYGVPFEHLIKIELTAEALATHLRRAGIWTKHDAQTKPQLVVSALQRAYGVELSKIREISDKF